MTAVPVYGRPTWYRSALTAMAVLAILAAIRFVWGVPKPLMALLMVSFAGWSVLAWAIGRTGIQAAWRSLLFQIAPWLIGLGLLLAIVYIVDRGGWLWLQITGYDVAPVEDLSGQIDLPVSQFVKLHPAFELETGAGLVLPSGVHRFSRTVIVPRGTELTIEPGAVLQFSPGSSLVSYSPIVARGTEGAPIVFRPQYRWLAWGVVGLVDAQQAVFEHVRFERGREAEVNGIAFIANLTVVNTDVVIRHSQFLRALGKDALNIRSGHILIEHNLFQDAYKDGLDIDAGSGIVRDNQFVDCEDEGIDLSGEQQVEVIGNTILDARGGRIGAEAGLEQIRAQNSFGYSDNP